MAARGCLLAFIGCFLLLSCHSFAPPEPRWVTRGRFYTTSWADITLTVDPIVGGRITSLRVHDQELITGPGRHAQYYGSTLWLSPQHRWWPEPAAVDTDPYWVQSAANPLTLVSRQDTSLGLQVKKSFRVVPDDSSLHLTYTLINRADTTRWLALWEVTRLAKDCDITMALDTSATHRPFPTHAGSVQNGLYRTHVGTEDTIAQKAAYNARGWVAYQCGTRLLIKQFANLSDDQLPPRQNEVEIYVADSAYVEVEQHSAYRAVGPGDSLRWVVRWYPRHVGATAEEERARRPWMERLARPLSLYNLVDRFFLSNISF